MPNMELATKELVQALQCEVQGKISEMFNGVSTDTRKLTPGMLFVALVGEKFDAHNFLATAVENGATGLVVNRGFSVPAEISEKVTIFPVEDTLKGYQAIASLWRSKFNIPIIAITGSNGKTTTKDLTAGVLSGKWKVLKTEANFNNEIGLPLTLLNLRQEHQAAVVEMGMRGLGQITELVNIARPNIGVVTNVGETHMELLGSMENIAKAKGELPEGIPDDGLVILNADDKFVAAMDKRTQAKVIYYGIEADGEVKAENIKTLEGGRTEFTLVIGEERRQVVLPILGIHNVYNSLAALAVGYGCGFTMDEMLAGLAKYSPTNMRFEYKKIGDFNIINDAYNASPMSTKAALNNLKLVAKGRKLLVMGDMFELGAVEVKSHEDIGALAAELGVDAVLTRGELTKHTARIAKAGGVPFVQICDSHEEAVKVLQDYLKPGDTALFKGSHGMHMEKIIEVLEKFYK